MRRSITVAVGVLLFCAVVIHLEAATIIVTNTNDSGSGSLRQALAVAHHGDRITFAVSGTITLTGGGLVVTKNVTISGPGANELSIDGNQAPFVFAVDAGKAATISGLTIRNGFDGIVNAGTLAVSNCVLSGNSSDGIGNDGLFSGQTASLTVVNSNVSDNGLSGIFNSAVELGVVTTTIRSTTVSGNSLGGVVANAGPNFVNVFITDCTISGNSAYGGIHAEGTPNLTVTNSTISGNSANAGFPAGDSGGGIYGAAGVRVENSPISGNSTATSGDGIYGVATEIGTAPLVAIQLEPAGAVSMSSPTRSK